MLKLGCVLGLIVAYPIFYLISIQSIFCIFCSLTLFAVVMAFNAGTVMFLTTRYFPVDFRFTGSCISFNLSMSLFGGLSPLIGLYLTQKFQSTIAPFILLIASSMITLLALKLIKGFPNDYPKRS